MDNDYDRHPEFQSTLPARGATRAVGGSVSTIGFQSTLPARGATTMQLSFFPTRQKISIHAPRTGSDVRFLLNVFVAVISIHAPRTGSDPTPQYHPQRFC